jgi:pilus assembly protein Flp/PilA
MFNKSLSREEGQGLVEYALILVLVAIVVIAILLVLGPQISDVYCRVANALQPGSCGALSVVSATSVETSPGKYKLTVVVSLAETADVTLNAEGKTQTESSCSSPCSLTVNNVPASGSFKVTALGGEVSGTY